MMPLIYDLGLHEGEDTNFYLLKGFRVVAVDADPLLCARAATRFQRFVANGQLTIVNRAITSRRGSTTFYRSATSGWGTVNPAWNEDNAARGIPSEEITVDGITLRDLVEECGEAYYLKLDIEGMDRAAVESLGTSSIRPPYLSMETTFSREPTFEAFWGDLKALARLGYDQFKIVDQQAVPTQVPPEPALVGNYISYRFVNGESGLFGEEAPGDWMPMDQAMAEFKRLMRGKWLQLRLYPRLRFYLYYCAIIHRLTRRYPNLGWYDIHARHSTAG